MQPPSNISERYLPTMRSLAHEPPRVRPWPCAHSRALLKHINLDISPRSMDWAFRVNIASINPRPVPTSYGGGVEPLVVGECAFSTDLGFSVLILRIYSRLAAGRGVERGRKITVIFHRPIITIMFGIMNYLNSNLTQNNNVSVSALAGHGHWLLAFLGSAREVISYLHMSHTRGAPLVVINKNKYLYWYGPYGHSFFGVI